MPVIPVLGRMSQDHEFEASLDYNSETLSQNNNKKPKPASSPKTKQNPVSSLLLEIRNHTI
jgi:hypothetical protein